MNLTFVLETSEETNVSTWLIKLFQVNQFSYLNWFSLVDSNESFKSIKLNQFDGVDWFSLVVSTEPVEFIQLDHMSWFNWITWIDSTESDVFNNPFFASLNKSVFINTQPAGISIKAAASEEAAIQVSSLK